MQTGIPSRPRGPFSQSADFTGATDFRPCFVDAVLHQAVLEVDEVNDRFALHVKNRLDVGDSIELEQVLLVADGDAITVGQPVVEGAKVVATITDQGKHKKIRVFKKKRRKGYRLSQGHRQSYTALTIAEISK